MAKQVDVLCIGHIDKGRIVVEGERTDATGGAIYYGGMVLRKLGLNIAVLTRVDREHHPRPQFRRAHMLFAWVCRHVHC